MQAIRLATSAVAISLTVVCTGFFAWAERWVPSGPRSSFGFTGCVDVDSVRHDADGFTYFRGKICEDDELGVAQYAVRCSQFSPVSMTIYQYIGSEWVPTAVEGTTIAAWDVHFACGQRR